MKRAISYVLTLAMLICMVPYFLNGGNAYATVTEGIVVDNTSISSGTYYINNGTGSITSAGADADNYNLYFISEENKILLRNAVITAGSLAIISNSDTVIELSGENYISAPTFPIQDGGDTGTDLIITGSGMLKVSASGKVGGNQSAGIATQRNVIIGGNALLECSGAEDTQITSGFGTNSYGIYAPAGSLTVADNAKVTLAGLYCNQKGRRRFYRSGMVQDQWRED